MLEIEILALINGNESTTLSGLESQKKFSSCIPVELVVATVNDKNATFSPIELHHDKSAGVSDIQRADSINKRRL